MKLPAGSETAPDKASARRCFQKEASVDSGVGMCMMETS